MEATVAAEERERMERKDEESQLVGGGKESASVSPAPPDMRSPEEREAAAHAHGRKSNYFFTLMFMVAILIAVVLKYGFESALGSWFINDACDNDNCVGNHSVYRISFASFLFFFVHGVLIVFWPSLHTQYWLLKILAFGGSLVVPFFISNSFFDGYASVSRVVSMLFLVLQVCILIDMAYDLHEYLTSTADADTDMTRRRKCTYLSLSLFVQCAGWIGIVLLFVYFDDCSQNIMFIAITLIAGVICILTSLLNVVDKGLLTPSIVFAYCVFLCWNAIWTNPDVDCNPNAVESEDDSVGLILLSVGIAVVALTWAASSAAQHAPDVCRGSEKEQLQAGDARRARVERHWVFHFVMAAGSMYFAMVLTNWSASDGEGRVRNRDVGDLSMWLKISSQWLTYVLYFWTLVAPVCCKQRDFTDPNNRWASH